MQYLIKLPKRRFAQYSIKRGRDGEVHAEDVDQALNEMLFDDSRLNRSVLALTYQKTKKLGVQSLSEYL